MPPKILGALERDIMQTLWKRGEATVRDVHDDIRRTRKIAYTTVMTVMLRLAEKGILRRTLDGSAYRYRPAADRTAFLRGMLRGFFASVKREYGEAAVASFLEELQRKKRQ